MFSKHARLQQLYPPLHQQSPDGDRAWCVERDGLKPPSPPLLYIYIYIYIIYMLLSMGLERLLILLHRGPRCSRDAPQWRPSALHVYADLSESREQYGVGPIVPSGRPFAGAVAASARRPISASAFAAADKPTPAPGTVSAFAVRSPSGGDRLSPAAISSPGAPPRKFPAGNGHIAKRNRSVSRRHVGASPPPHGALGFGGLCAPAGGKVHLPDMQQAVFSALEPQDPHPLAHWRKALQMLAFRLRSSV